MLGFPWERTPQQRYADGWDAIWGKKPEKTDTQKVCGHPGGDVSVSMHPDRGHRYQCRACGWQWTKSEDA